MRRECGHTLAADGLQELAFWRRGRSATAWEGPTCSETKPSNCVC